jgi:anthraniloyl-CoA monooxygenase
VIGADGVNSTTRTKYVEHFNPRIDVRKCRFIWLGTKMKLNAFTFAFKQTEWGWFNLHAYQFNEEWATFIVETPEETWLKAGLDQMDPDQSIAFCENLFADMLDGAKLISNARHLRGSAVWIKFNRVLCERWFKDNIVLLGDAAHTAHFTIGSGTKLAMEDARALVNVLMNSRRRRADAAGALPVRARNRGAQAAKRRAQPHDLVRACRSLRAHGARPVRLCRAHWQPARRPRQPEAARPRATPTTSTAGSPRNAACHASGRGAVPPMFTPFTLRGMKLANRVVVSPMCTYSATDGMPATSISSTTRRAASAARRW